MYLEVPAEGAEVRRVVDGDVVGGGDGFCAGVGEVEVQGDEVGVLAGHRVRIGDAPNHRALGCTADLNLEDISGISSS